MNLDETMIPFNRPYLCGKELAYIQEAANIGQLAGDGHFTKKSTCFLEKHYKSKVLITHSCTAALEIAAILLNIKDGDEIIMPSYTFVSTANAFVLRGGVPIFIDIDEKTLCIDANKIERAITKKTKAIVCVHYAGISGDMERIIAISKSYSIPIVEDAAQAFGSYYKGKKLGTFGDLATLSFHETKNIISGEGGCLIINNNKYYERAEIIREKGTDRSLYFRGMVDKYTWRSVGSSFLPGDLVAAFLLAQLENHQKIQERRMDIWNKYNSFLGHIDTSMFKGPRIPAENIHNAHMFYLLCADNEKRNWLITELKKRNIMSVFHYVPLHKSPAGQKYGRVTGLLDVTNSVSSTIVRLPMFVGLSEQQITYISGQIKSLFRIND